MSFRCSKSIFPPPPNNNNNIKNNNLDPLLDLTAIAAGKKENKKEIYCRAKKSLLIKKSLF